VRGLPSRLRRVPQESRGSMASRSGLLRVSHFCASSPHLRGKLFPLHACAPNSGTNRNSRDCQHWQVRSEGKGRKVCQRAEITICLLRFTGNPGKRTGKGNRKRYQSDTRKKKRERGRRSEGRWRARWGEGGGGGVYESDVF